jgi:acetate kinase
VILAVNAGSSSLKLALVEPDDSVICSQSSRLSGADRPTISSAIEQILGQPAAPPVDVAVHRVVHGGPHHDGPAWVDAELDKDLERLRSLAPLHNPPALAAIETLEARMPGLPQAACFDTAFHRTIPPEAATYPIPKGWTARWGLRRYGFHGLSHSWASRRAAALLGRPPHGLRLVTAHIGSGASLAAVRDGLSVDTTMGFTPLEGLVMSTRSGTVDPGLLLWAQRQGNLSAAEVEAVLEHDSGLLGMSGRSGNLREVIASADQGDSAAGLAYGVYLHRLRASICAMAGAMGGIDGLVFTGGAGEASPRLRHDACRGLEFLGLVLDEVSNEAALGSDAIISPADSPVSVAVVATREHLEMAREVRRLLQRPQP